MFDLDVASRVNDMMTAERPVSSLGLAQLSVVAMEAKVSPSAASPVCFVARNTSQTATLAPDR